MRTHISYVCDGRTLRQRLPYKSCVLSPEDLPHREKSPGSPDSGNHRTRHAEGQTHPGNEMGPPAREKT